MTFLKKIGGILLKVGQIATGLGPLIPGQYQQVSGKVIDYLEQVANIVITVEGVGQALQLPGADKLKAAAPLVAQVIQQSDFMVGKKINDPILFAKGAQKIADGMVDILNSLKDEIATTDLT